MIHTESTSFTPSSRRKNRVQFGIEDIMSNRHSDIKDNQQQLLEEQEMKKIISFEESTKLDNYNSITASDIVKKETKIDNLETYIYGEAFAELVYMSVPLDDSYKKKNKETIKENASYIYNNLKSINALNEGNYMWKQYEEKFSSRKEDLFNESNNPIALASIIKSIESDTATDRKDITSLIESKVLKTVENEKYISENRENLIKRHKKFNGNTLFNSLMIRNLKLTESNILFSDGNQKDMVSKALSESIVDYTILETLNTMELINFNVDNIGSLSNRIAKSDIPEED